MRNQVLYLDSVGEISTHYFQIFILTNPLVLHPYYKLAYIKVAWGGPEEQANEIAAGNIDAKDWQDEAKQVVEKTGGYLVSYVFQFICLIKSDTDGTVL